MYKDELVKIHNILINIDVKGEGAIAMAEVLLRIRDLLQKDEQPPIEPVKEEEE